MAAPIFPAFNDSFVISEYLEMSAGASIIQNVADEKFEADTLSPANVSLICFPALEEVPCEPVVLDDNANSNP